MQTVTPRASAPGIGFTPVAIRFALLGASIFFAAMLIAYFAARTGQIDANVTSGRELQRIQMPVWFWFSTLVILVSSLSLWGAKKFAQNSDARLAGRALWAATALGYGFLILQVPGFFALLAEHRAMADQRVFVYAVIVILFALHAAHVLGGLVPLTAVTLKSGIRPLTTDRVPVLRYLGWYWHYLALVWFVIFNVLMLVG